jgi:hypothetical protein
MLVEKIKKGDLFQKGTSATVYIALTDESARGWITCKAVYVSFGQKFRVNTNHDPITPYTEEGN